MTAEEYIKAYTRGCSNELVGGGYHEWLTPENALAAVELAREEMKKDAIEGKIVGGKCDLIHLKEGTSDYRSGEKVKVIIIKE